MAKKVLKISGIVVACLFTAALLIYLMIAYYYMNKFAYNTYVNDKYVTGMTVNQVNDILASEYPKYELEIKTSDETIDLLGGEEIGFSVDYSESLSTALASQSRFLWPEYLGIVSTYKAEPTFSYDEALFDDVIDSVDGFVPTDNEKESVYIEEKLGKYFLVNDTKPILDTATARGLIENAVLAGDNSVSIADCFSSVKYNSAQQKTVDLFDKINKYQSTDITYVDDDIVRHLDFTETNDWLTKGEDGIPVLGDDGELTVNEDMVREFAASLSKSFNTDNEKAVWTRKDGSEVELLYRGTGYEVDEESEVERLMSNVYSGNVYERAPIYSQEAPGRGNSIVGDSYVEVDLGNQKVYCYVNNELKLKCDCVSGNVNRHCDTPAMISDIYFMQKNRTLRGENYASFVYYWMAFYNHYGLHDATWRDKFGGDIYLHDGSHGCVNLPKEKAAELYDLVHVGTPVVIYYGPEEEEGGDEVEKSI